MFDLEKINDEYRPIPFWSWNDKLNINETKNQIREMHDVGIGGFFMHARGGLITEYFSEEWFKNIDAGINEARNQGLTAWIYDENGWPSGFGNGKVSSLGTDFQQKCIKRASVNEQNIRNIIWKDDFGIYYIEVNPYYVDILNPEVAEKFIEYIYEPYYKRFNTKFSGIFTDEPQVTRVGLPWSKNIHSEYLKKYNRNLNKDLCKLFLDIGNFKEVRINFYKLVTDMMSKNYVKKIFDWCVSRNIEFTGHFLLEETLETQLLPNGSVMPHYEYLTMPGIDWLGRNIDDVLTPLQVGSVAQQLGKKRVLVENFAMSGHGVSFDELRRIFEWQIVHGVNVLCPHLEGYSLRGSRKRDYPPALFKQQPWWRDYKIFVETMSHVCTLLSRGKVQYDVLLIHPQTTAWSIYNGDDNPGLEKLNKNLLSVIRCLEAKHILFHLGDETIIERHGKVENNKFIIGTQIYDKLIILEDSICLSTTNKLLNEYKKNGGKIVNASEIIANDIIDNSNITYTERNFKNSKIHYFVNSTSERQVAKFKSNMKKIDLRTGVISYFSSEYNFPPFSSLMLLEEQNNKKNIYEEKQAVKMNIPLDGKWKIKGSYQNSITLDMCDYYFDGVLQEREGFVLNIQQRALELKKELMVKMVFYVEIEFVSEPIFLAMEGIESSVVLVNGNCINLEKSGFFIDKSFEKVEITSDLIRGRNTIEINTRFHQRKELYTDLKKAKIFESEKNKLNFETEIEPVYLVGNFSVFHNGEVNKLPRNSIRCDRNFVLRSPVKNINLKNIEQQGFLFFSGELTIEKKFSLKSINYQMNIHKIGVNSVRIKVNGKSIDPLIFDFSPISLSEYLIKGNNLIQLTIVNNLRNLMGPHHLMEGESYDVTPGSFYKEPCIWANNPQKFWNDDYCFIETSVLGVN
jgi:hypothetical protein